MKKILSTLVMCLILGVSSVWAETYTTGKHNYNGTPQQYLDAFNNAHGKYVTMTASSGAEMKTPEGYIRPGGKGSGVKTGHITLTAAAATYVHSFTAILGGSNHNGKPVTLRWNAAPVGEADLFSASWTTYDVITEGADKSVEKTSYNEQTLAVYTGGIKQFLGGNENNAHLQDVSTTIWVPEVVSKTDGQTAPEDYSVTAKPSGKGASIEFTLEYNVKHAVNAEDFTAEISNRQGKGILIVSKKELVSGADAENKKLKVTCTYTAANEEDFATNYSADLVISSKNTVNTNTFTTHITGTAGTIKANNELKWIISGPYYVNTTIDNPTFTNSDAPITYDSSDPSVAEFVDGKLVLKSAGTTTLSASQVETNEIKASNCEDLTIIVEKRTPAFTINPGDEVYTSLIYSNYISPANDPNGTMNPMYKSLDELLFTVDAGGNLTTNAGLGTATLQAIVEPTDEWNGGTYEFTVNVVRDPIHVPLCLTEEQWNNPRFFIEKTGAGAAFWENGALKLGGSHSSNAVTTSVVFHITGSPEYLNIGSITKDNRINSITIEQSSNNEDWLPVGDPLTDVITNLSRELSATTKYIKITYVGVQLIAITDLCITERVGASIIPDPIELVLMNGTVIDASFTASVSNLTELKLHLDSDDFILVRDGKTYDTETNTLLLDYTDGLGIDKNVSASIKVQYVGLDDPVGKTCTLSALNEDDEVQATAVVKITEITSVGDVPGVIVPTNAGETGIYTGTEKGTGDGGAYEKFPYRKKTQVDLTKTFDKDGNALFDILYIFGLTTETDDTHDNINLPSSSLACNAKTYCYVYHKSDDGKKYEFNTLFDAVSSREHSDHGEGMNGKHLYFTGYCPFANIGVAPGEEGWMYFVGGNTGVDIYLENCTILGRYRTSSGKSSGFAENVVTLEASSLGANNENINYMSGFSSIFVFRSSSNDNAKSYKPTIHISGDNHLKGQLGYISKVIGRVTMAGDLINKEVETGIGNITTVSSPITIKPDAKGGYTDLTMDDLWPTNATHTTKEVTNGFLRLDAYKTSGSASEKVPCVDLGSEFGSLTINGGQYMLRNSAADGTYTCNMAFSYRKFSKLAQKEVIGIQVEALLSLYGFGGDQTDCRVVINGGTFNMYKNMYPNGTSYLGSNYYIDQDNFLDLRLPAGRDSRFSHINGGTFNGISHVVFCSQVTSSGKSPINHAEEVLCLQDVVIEGPNVDQNNGTVKFVVPEPFSDYYDETDDDKVGYNLSTGLNDVVECTLYGGQSANSYTKNIGGEDKNVVSILLPAGMCEDATCTDCELFDEAIYYNWVTAIPMFNISVEGQEVSIGGGVEVPTTEGGEIKYVVNQMLYTDLEGMEDAAMTGDVNIGFADKNNTRGQFTNPDNYRIYKNLNTLKVVEADRWYCFVAPYDIHEISVIETAETQLSKDEYKNNRTAAKELQAQNNLKMFYELSNFILPDPNGRASSLTLNQLLCRGCLKTPGLWRIPLYHYNGQKAADENYGRPVMTANYYLYEITNSGFDKTTTTNAKDTFHIDWKPVHREGEAGQPLMKQGRVYAIQFPWCPMCNDWEDRTYYDYWTGKLILFYGHGYDNAGTENDGQLIYGIDGQTALTTAPGQGQAVYAGNYSFADMTAPSNAFVHDYDVDGAANPGDWFIPAPNDHKVKPTEGFMLYNPGASPMPARISRSGQIEYRDNTATGMNGVPTVGDRTTLMVMDAYDGFEILSLRDQRVAVYNLQGNVVFQSHMAEGEQVHVSAAEGVYVVVGEHETIKLMVD